MTMTGVLGPMGLLPLNFAKNYFWPTLFALGLAIVTGLTAGAPGLIGDGLQASDLPAFGGIIVTAVLGYLATIMTRYGGKKEPWSDPAIPPTAREKLDGL